MSEPTRLELLLEKMNKPPCQLTDNEAMELQKLLTEKHKTLREDRSKIGGKFGKKKSGKAELLAELENL